MHAATPRLTTTSNATIYFRNMNYLSVDWNMDCCHSSTAIYIFLYILIGKNNGKNISFNPGLISKFFNFQNVNICHPYVICLM